MSYATIMVVEARQPTRRSSKALTLMLRRHGQMPRSSLFDAGTQCCDHHMTDREEIIEVLARYVRANDTRSGTSLVHLLTEDVLIEILQHDGKGGRVPLAEPMRGRDTLVDVYDNLMPAHERGHWSHHVTSDHLVTVDGDRGSLNAQFMMFRVARTPKPSEDGRMAPSVPRASSRPRERLLRE
ncbi:nuclear transport factor 2 family protein [Streptomyces sp. T1317-0309]|nr:nuclear transport factor 2 family protein [Streptomyces sp. T1317-0309]